MSQIRLDLISWIESKKRVLKFLIIGGSLYLLSAGLLFQFQEILEIEDTLAYKYVTVITYTIQFILNAIFTWGDRGKSWKQNVWRIGKYVPIKFLIWYLNQHVNAFWVSLGFHNQIAHAISVILIMAVNYLVFDRLIFTK